MQARFECAAVRYRWLTLFVALAFDMANATDPAATDAPAVDGSCPAATDPAVSIEDAVVSMSRCYLDISVREDREYIGAVLSVEAGYTFVVQKGEIGRGNARLRVSVPKGQRVVALWHTHGAPGPARQFFSPTDTKRAARMNLPFYLTDPTGAIRVYRPGDVRNGVEKRTGSRMQVVPGSALGTLVVSRAGDKVITKAEAETEASNNAPPPAERQAP
ncbi:MAG: DUF4329 domain-containing protein [Gammaproteobacteria bacterium]|nr:DUF4329 domain-containing protein [Gammaproteobacteria bacterium]